MATIVLQAAGAFLGGAFGAFGTAIGSAAGAVAGYVVDRALLESTRRYEGPRLAAARPFTAEDGASLPRLYGTVRVGGTLIWATRFEERRTTERQGGKLGPKVTTYSYYANVAFAICEGEIAGVRRIWADGREIDRDRFEIRIYRGTEDQLPDPLIEAKQGKGNAPAYRGTAYAVIERFPIDDYGRRIPQFHFEVMRPARELNERIRAVTLIPGSTEYGLSPTLVTQRVGPGETAAVNRHNRYARTDFEASLDELQALCPNLKTVSLVVTWFGTDLRAGECKIRPMVTRNDPKGFSAPWLVSGVSRQQAHVVSTALGHPAYGGTPTDRSVREAIAAIRARGLKVGLYPFVMMDVPAESELPSPYGEPSQPAYPWRGRITCHPAPGRQGTPDKTAAVRAQIAALAGTAAPGQFSRQKDTISFNGTADEWSYRRFVLHYAHLAMAAGGVDSFLIGSELRGLTTLRDGYNRFPFVELLENLASEVRGILGEKAAITYAADWSEYFGYHPQDGSGDVFFHLDSLWAHPDIDAVGIDNYMPLSDWRDADTDGSNPDGMTTPYDLPALRAGIVSGEGYDWFYASIADRVERKRTPIIDGAYGKHWVFRNKDLVSWWSNHHYNRIAGVEEAAPTAWVPKSKPFHFTELGCGAVDKGPNQPNVFPDAKSSESFSPYFSNGGRSDLAQYRFLQAHYLHWLEGGQEANPVSPIYGSRMVDVDAISLWAWDARPYPAFPVYADIWSDGANWSRGHWLNGRLSGISVGALIDMILADHGQPPADTSRADGMVTGYIVADPTTARAAIEPIARLFGLGVLNGDDGLVFASEGAGVGKALVLNDLVRAQSSGTVERQREPDHALPASAQLDFRNPLNDHQSATASIAYLNAGGTGTSFISFPGVLPTGEAERLVRDLLRRTWDGRERVRFAVPATERRVEPGSIVRLPGVALGPEYLVTEVEDGLTRRVDARRIARVPSSPAREEEKGEERVGTGREFTVSQPEALFLDLPLRSATDAPEDQFRIAVHAVPWRTQAVLVSPEETGFALRATAPERAVIGALESSLPGGRVEGRFDRSSGLTVRLLSGELYSVSRLQLLNGANAAAIQSAAGVWEIVQFEEAEEVEPDLWHLTNLLRGQLGTNDAMSAGAKAGASFVLLDDAVTPAGLTASEIGLDLNWRIGPMAYDISGENYLPMTGRGGERALMPLSPVHLRSRVEGGDLHLSWLRRGRIDADSWLAEDIPLGEEREEYRIEIAPVGGSPRRIATVSSPEWIYSADMRSADFPEPSQIEVTVRQMSVAIGAGLPARTILSLP
ncbi:glycoside hydrolase TIM-barrel-like domain-containing protein [Chelativorans sp. Marseille-P2723]|uniref:baseplate multidomain protein megatron n=1 Tax=Chelativorans sp. Marseille-P2723 TaxID=2709133 RepID=UPI00156DD19F|nr:glycoside hydrolase TIM-barrel-like domain-containing protein [Chelativorans sp. Marseille-P2723]